MIIKTTNSFCPTGEGGGVDPTCSPGKGKLKVGSAVDEILSRASDIKFTEEKFVKGEEVGRRDYDEIEERMTREEQREMESSLEKTMNDSIRESANDYDPDVSESDVMGDAGYKDKDVNYDVEKLIEQHVEDEELQAKLKEINDDWYHETNDWGLDAIDEVSSRLDDDAPEELKTALSEYRSAAEAKIDETRDEQVEYLRDEYRRQLESEYDVSDDRAYYLREFHDQHADEPRFAGSQEETPDRTWGRDKDGDRLLNFSVASGEKFEILAYPRKVAEGIETTNVSFSDESGKYEITGKLGARGAAEVFRTVSASVVALVQKENPNSLEFTAAEPSRQSLYDKLTKTVTKVVPGYAAVAITKLGKPKTYVVAKRELLPELVEKFKSLNLADAQIEQLVNKRRTDHVKAEGRNSSREDQAGVRPRVADRGTLVTRNQARKGPTNPLRSDPTRTATLRRQFENEMVRRFVKFRRKLVSLIVDEDAFGLGQKDQPFVMNAKMSSTQFNVTDPECLRLIRELQGRLDPTDVIELEEKPHVTVRYGLLGQDPEAVRELVANVFCKTGEGGGVDPTCSPKGLEFTFDRGASRHKKVADHVATAINELKAKGVSLPNKIQVAKLSSKSIVAWHDNNDHEVGSRVTINPLSSYWTDPASSAKRLYESGRFSTDNPNHVIFHEVGHSAHKRSITADQDSYLKNHRFYGDVLEIVKSEVSSYATTNGYEFVAEVFAGMIHGKIYSETIRRQYDLLHGPKVLSQVTNSFGPVWMTIGRLSLFQHPDQDVLYLSVESQGLERLNQELGKLPHTQTHDDYVPHLTIARLKPGTGWKYLADPSFLEWQSYAFTELTFSDRERRQTGIALNVFCPTGEGGGVDPSCSPRLTDLPHSSMTFYHGSGADFSEFDVGKLHTGADRGSSSWYGHGIYLSGEEWKGASYAHAAGTSGKLYEVRAKVENPLVVRGTAAGKMGDALQAVGLDRNLIGQEVTDSLSRLGYDSVLVLKDDGKKINELVVFDPKKLKILLKRAIHEQVQNVRWAFHSSPEKVKEFLKWLEGNLRPILTDESTTEDDWWDKYVMAGFKKGAARSYDDMKKAGAIPQSKLPFYLGQKDEFLKSAFRQPESVEKVKLLAGRVYTELKGVTEAMSQNLTRTLTDGLTQGMNPRQIATNIVKDVNGIGIKRARLIARTEIIRAHAEGQLDSMERLGVKKLAVMVEWNTAGDARVCPLCQPLEGIVLTMDEAKGLLPRHVQCRCAWVPANVGEDQSEQVRGAARIKKAIQKSLVAGKPKRGKIKSSWAGAKRKISSFRPKSRVSSVRSLVRNIFCRTGQGGGIDPSCSPKQRGVSSAEHTVPPTEKSGTSGLTAESYIDAAKKTSEDQGTELIVGIVRQRMERANEKWLNKVHEDVVKIESNVERLEKRHQSSCDALDKLLVESASLAGQVKGDLSESDRELLGRQVELNKKIDEQAEKVDKALSSLFKARRERTDKALKVIRDFNKDGLQPTFDKTMKIGETHDLPGYQQEAVANTEKAMRGLLHSDYHGQAVGKTHVRMVPEDAKQRAYFSGERHGGDHSMFITKSDGVATVAHEFGHAMETNDLVHFAAKGFLYHRVGKEVAKSMGQGYEGWEVGMDDDFGKAFSSPRYVGKFYKSRDTEVISMGMEKMMTEPVHFAKKDPEYFKFMVGVMSGTIL